MLLTANLVCWPSLSSSFCPCPHNRTTKEVEVEEIHHTHKEPAWGWVSVLKDWRRSRTRARIRKADRIVATARR